MTEPRMDQETYRILKHMDVDAALKRVATDGFIPDTPTIALAGLHKARLLQGRRFTKAERAASRDWLLANGYKTEIAR